MSLGEKVHIFNIVDALVEMLEKQKGEQEDAVYISLKEKDGVYCSLDYQSLLMGVKNNTFSPYPTIYKVENKEDLEYIKSLGYIIEFF